MGQPQVSVGARVLSQKVVTGIVTKKPQVDMGFCTCCHSCHHFSVTTSREITFRREVQSRCHRNVFKAVTDTHRVIAGENTCRHLVTKSGDRNCDNETPGKHPFPYPLSQLSPLFCDNFYENHVSERVRQPVTETDPKL